VKENIVKEKSFELALDIVNLYKNLTTIEKEYIISKQILRCGTSVGANVREALNGESAADFIHKLSISQKEADETLYWLELLKAAGFIDENQFANLSNKCNELLKILKSIILTVKEKNNE